MEHYQIPSLNPVIWPAEKNNSDASDDDDAEDPAKKKAAKLNRRKSKYQALERAVSSRGSLVPGSEKTANGVGNLVQKDEPDPLGTTDSVVRTLKQYGLPLQSDPKLRNRFLLSSTTFSPALFLSPMRATADTQQLYALKYRICDRQQAFEVMSTACVEDWYPNSFPNPSQDWSWATVPSPPPFPKDCVVTAYAMHPDGRTLFVSCANSRKTGRHTYSFDTRSHEWTSHGDWVLPFQNQGYFDGELDAWVGLRKDGYVCSCRVPSQIGRAHV